MTRPFLQTNLFRHPDIDRHREFVKQVVDVAVQRCCDVELPPVSWGLWRPEGEAVDHYWLTEWYPSAQAWGSAEDIGVTDPGLRNAIAEMANTGIVIETVYLYIDLKDEGRLLDHRAEQLVRIELDRSIRAQDAVQLFESCKALFPDPAAFRAQLYRARVSGEAFNRHEIWLRSGQDDAVLSNARKLAQGLGATTERLMAIPLGERATVSTLAPEE